MLSMIGHISNLHYYAQRLRVVLCDQDHLSQNHDYKKERIYSKSGNWLSDVCALSNGIQ